MGSKKLNVAVVLASGLFSGGGFQYEYSVLAAFKKYHKNSNIKLKYYCLDSDTKNDYDSLNLDINVLKENVLQKIHRQSFSILFFRKLYKKLSINYSSIERRFLKDQIDIIYFFSPNDIALALNEIPYVFTLWDLGHLEILEFPEVSHNGSFESREFLYLKALKKSFRVIVDSKYGKSLAADKYNLDEKRIEIVKFIPNIREIDHSLYINIKEKYELKNNYIFYPAQFWPHKNHIYILKAIKILREDRGIDIDVVFSGADKGNLDYILTAANNLGIRDLIHYIGFVSNEEIPYLYNQSLALVMPTYLGPTNIPPLEAFAYKTSLCYSDMPFFREQVGDAAFFMDLQAPSSLVDILIKILGKDDMVKIKKDLGTQLLNDWTDLDAYKKINNIFIQYSHIRELWS